MSWHVRVLRQYFLQHAHNNFFLMVLVQFMLDLIVIRTAREPLVLNKLVHTQRPRASYLIFLSYPQPKITLQ